MRATRDNGSETSRPIRVPSVFHPWLNSSWNAHPSGGGRELDRVEAGPLAVVERGGHRGGLAVDPGDAEELVSFGGGPVPLHPIGDRLELDPGAEGVVELRRAEGAGVERAGDELPERVELGEPGPRRVVGMR